MKPMPCSSNQRLKLLMPFCRTGWFFIFFLHFSEAVINMTHFTDFYYYRLFPILKKLSVGAAFQSTHQTQNYFSIGFSGREAHSAYAPAYSFTFGKPAISRSATYTTDALMPV